MTVALATLVVLPAAQAQTPGTWQTLTSSGPDRQEVSYVELGGKLYLGAGSNDAVFDGVTDTHEVYDPATGQWSDVAPLEVAVDHVQSVALNGEIYYIGGLTAWPQPASSAVQIYDPENDSFVSGEPMPSGRQRGAGGVAVHDGKIYYAGGLAGGSAVAWFDVYDPVADAWSGLPDMPRARDHFHAAVVGGKFYAIGGRDTAINATMTHNDAYNFSTGAWEPGKAALPTARGGYAAAVVGDEVLVIGGEGGGNSFDDVEAYNTATNAWRTLASMPTARHGIQAALCNGGVYIAAGGLTQGGANPTDAHETFFLGDPTTCGSAPEPTPDPTPDPDPSPSPEPTETATEPPAQVARGPCEGLEHGSMHPNPDDPSGVGQIIVGTDGDDTIEGTPGDDIICALAGNDLIRGGPGDDQIVGGPGDDDLRGGRGNDEIRGSGGADVLRGGPDDDTLFGGSGRDLLLGGRGSDRLFGGPGRDRLFGGLRPGRNFLHGGRGSDRCTGRSNTIFHRSCNIQRVAR